MKPRDITLTQYRNIRNLIQLHSLKITTCSESMCKDRNNGLLCCLSTSLEEIA